MHKHTYSNTVFNKNENIHKDLKCIGYLVQLNAVPHRAVGVDLCVERFLRRFTWKRERMVYTILDTEENEIYTQHTCKNVQIYVYGYIVICQKCVWKDVQETSLGYFGGNWVALWKKDDRKHFSLCTFF